MLVPLKRCGWRGQVWYSGWKVPRVLLVGFAYEKHSKARPKQKRYYTTKVVRHRYVIGTEEQQLHKISHWADKQVLLWFFSLHLVVPRVGPGYPFSAFTPPLSIHFLIFCSLLLFLFFLFSSTLLIFFCCPSDPFLPE